jgi:hypothetical protein
MPRRVIAAALSTLLIGLPVSAQSQARTQTQPQSSTSSSAQESGNPIDDQGSSYNYRSNITQVVPSVPGLDLEVLEFADRLLLTNHTGKTVVVYGYQDEPYARVTPTGTVEVNTSSPAYYLNQNFYGDVNVPASASPTAKPHWTVIDRTGQLEWHDHRIHWMSPALPPQVKDKGKRTKIFDWQVPIRIGATPATVHGQLLWVPEEGTETPLAAIVALVVVALAGIAFVVVVRKRRSSGGPPSAAGQTPDGAGSPAETERPSREAW